MFSPAELKTLSAHWLQGRPEAEVGNVQVKTCLHAIDHQAASKFTSPILICYNSKPHMAGTKRNACLSRHLLNEKKD